MADIYCYSYVEDAPSAAVARKLVTQRNSGRLQKLHFYEGFPAITGGYGELRKKCPSLLNMAKAGLYTFSVTDLDMHSCAVTLIRDCFRIKSQRALILPKELVFRVAVREIEAWIIADRHAWAEYIGIPEVNFSITPDTLPDPKQHLLNVIRNKGTKKAHQEMLPRRTANIGPRYNQVLCDFVSRFWSPKRAAANSPSLRSAIEALRKV